MLSAPSPTALENQRRAGRAALRHAVAATLLGSLLLLPGLLSPANAQTRDADKKNTQSRSSTAKAVTGKATDRTPNAKTAGGKTASGKAPNGKAVVAGAAALKPVETKLPETKPSETNATGSALQLGLFPRESDAWWAWETLQRRQPDLTKGLAASVSLLDGKTEAGGVVLRATISDGTDEQRLCRRIVGAGFGCLIIDAPGVATAAVVADPEPKKSETAKSAPPPPPAAVAAVAPPPIAPAVATTVTVPVAPATLPTEPVVASSVLTPIASASAAPLVPPPSVAKAVPPVDGTVIYTEEDARTMADIEQHSRRKGRLRSVMPDSRLDVMPAALKLEGWNLCALTFDDGPHRTVTRQVLDVLNRENVRATYFPVGKIAQNQGDLIRDFIAGGHEIGNHSLTHSDLRAMGAEGQRYEIAETNRILRSFGANPVLFRPPYGRYSNELLAIAREERMGSVLWTVDTRDWKVRNADKIVQHIKTGGGTGNVFLMHSTYPTTAQALPRVIAELRAKGCEFVTLSDWLERMRMLALPKIVNAGMPMPAPAAAPPAAAAITAARN